MASKSSTTYLSPQPNYPGRRHNMQGLSLPLVEKPNERQCLATENVFENETPPPLPPRPPTPGRGLAKPIAIPATSHSLGSPFLRAYPPGLGTYGISRATFLNFLDDLNRVAVVSPPLIMLSVACNAAGLVPEPTVQIVAFSTDLVNNAAMYAVSKGRMEMVLRKANKEIFRPHGLRAQVAKLEAVAYLAGMPILDSEKKVIKGSTILAPHGDIHEIHTLSGQQRRLKALEPWISPLDVQELPEIQERKNPVSKLSVSLSEWQREHGEKKLITGRKKAMDKQTADQQKAVKRLEKDFESILKVENQILEKTARLSDEDELKLGKKRQKAVDRYDEALGKMAAKKDKKDKEEQGIRKIHFLLLSSADDDTSSVSGMESELGSEGEGIDRIPSKAVNEGDSGPPVVGGSKSGDRHTKRNTRH